MASREPWRAEASRALLSLGAEVRAGGRELLDSASVLSVTANDRACRASVQDGVETYQLEGPLRSIECSCYDGGDCEHVAAALMHLLVSGPLDGGGGGEPESKPSGPMLVPRAAAEPMGLPLDMRSAMAQFAFETWLKRFRKAEVGPQGRLVFLLSFSEVGLCVCLARQRPGKAKAWLAPRKLTLQETQGVTCGVRGEEGLDDVLRSLVWGADGLALLDGRMGALGMDAMLRSGRLLFDDAKGQTPRQPLALGPVRSGRLFWAQRGEYYRADADLGEPGLILVPTTPAYYIDPKRVMAGRVKFRVAPGPTPPTLARDGAEPEQEQDGAGPEIDPDVLNAWFEAPAVPASAVPAVAAAFKAANLSLPVPAHVPVRVVGGPPRGQLVLYDEPGEPDYLRHRAAMWFVYEDVRVLPRLEADEPFKVEGVGAGERVRIHRDYLAEDDAHRALLRFGFHKYEIYDGDPEPDYWTLESELDWVAFALEGVQALRAEGIEVVIDPSFSVQIIESDDYFAEIEGSDNEWFDLEFGIEVRSDQGVERVSLLPVLLQALRDGATLEEDLLVDVPSGGFAKVSAERVAPLLEVLLQLVTSESRGKPRMNRWQAMDLAHLLKLESDTGRGLRGLRDALARDTELSVPKLPKSFLATLRGYQAEGLAWLSFLGEHGIGGVLADDMGLGKTVQILALISARRKASKGLPPSLVVAPTSVLLSWTEQLAAFAPGLKLVVWHGAARHEHAEALQGAHVVLTTYALLHRDVEQLKAVSWDVLVLDEAQAIKNPKAVAGAAARSLNARQRIAVTGTPLENHLGELWSLFAFVAPGVLGSQQAFRLAYRTPIEKDGDQARMDSLRRRVAPLMLRRTKEQVASDLPPKTIITHSVELGSAQRDLYETVRKSVDKQVREEIARRGVALSKIAVLDALLKLRQVCCDPTLVKSAAAHAKRVPSAKREAFFELIETLIDEGRRVLVFSQFVKMLDVLGEGLLKRKIPHARLTGATTNRAHQVEIFQSGAVPVFLISLKAGGVGLNLTRADAVIHYDPWWNPAAEAQATDRAHRIGQVNPVFVHRLIARGTVEEKIVALQARKAELAQALLSGGSQALSLDEALIDELLAPLPR